jgi:hypothetical protein
MIRRRLRGILRTTIATCIPWTAVGLAMGVLLQLDRGAGEYMVSGRPAPGGLAALWAVRRTRVLGEQVPVGSA